jgi:hypothetical protein
LGRPKLRVVAPKKNNKKKKNKKEERKKDRRNLTSSLLCSNACYTQIPSSNVTDQVSH